MSQPQNPFEIFMDRAFLEPEFVQAVRSNPIETLREIGITDREVVEDIQLMLGRVSDEDIAAFHTAYKANHPAEAN
jgi:hypothetical protein